MSQVLGDLPVGGTIDVKGPLGHVTYEGRGSLMLGHSKHNVRCFAMLCGGTGITPIYQIITAILKDDQDLTEMHLLYANRTLEDILLREELEQYASKYPSRLKVTHVISRHSANNQDLIAGQTSVIESNLDIVYGRMTPDLVTARLPSGTDPSVFALLCGPEGLLHDVCTPALVAHGYGSTQRVYF